MSLFASRCAARTVAGATLCRAPFSTHVSADSPVLFAQSGSAMVVTLNRPKALNSLNLDMVRLIAPQVKHWDKNETVATVVLRGTGGKAFCAGGDIKSLYDGRSSPDNAAKAEAFFREEYTLDYALAQSSKRKPHVAIYDGTVMGGGVGISINATFRIATEKTLFAMPETGIGLFPDVGGSYFLPRIPKNIGTFLALTGHRLKGSDVVHAGVATHLVPSEKVAQLEKEIAAIPAGHGFGHTDIAKQVEAVIQRHTAPLAPFSLKDDQIDVLSNAFGKDSVESIMATLKSSAERGSHVSAQALAALRKMSPTSLKVTLEQMKRGSKLSLAECYHMELRMAVRFMQGVDFYEGVRSVLVDKDNSPRWSPAELSAVTDAEVASYFAPLKGNDLVLPLP